MAITASTNTRSNACLATENQDPVIEAYERRLMEEHRRASGYDTPLYERFGHLLGQPARKFKR